MNQPRAGVATIVAAGDRHVRDWADVGWGTHLCLVHDAPAEALSAAAAFLAAGLRRGERCAYLVADQAVEDVLGALRDGGVDVEQERERGALELIAAEEYARVQPFDPVRICERLRLLLDDALRADFAGLRLAVDMSWTQAGGGVGPEQLVEYEAMTNALVFARGPVAAICIYDRARFPAELLEHVERLHTALGPGAAAAAAKGNGERDEMTDAPEIRKPRGGWLGRGGPAAVPASEAEASAAARLAFLAEAGRVLSSSLEYETTLSSVARLSVPAVADYCIIDLVEERGAIRRVATAHRDPALEELTAELRHFPPLAGRPRGVPNVLATGETELVTDVDEAVLHDLTRDEAHLRIVRELGAASYLIVPLIAREQKLGAITLVYTDSGRRYGPADLTLAEELARHAALALDNARLYRDAQAELAERREAREELDRKHRFVRLLLDVTTAANEATTFEEAVRIALERVRAHTGWPIGHAYACRPGGQLVSTTIWSADDPDRFATLREVTESVSFALGIGLPGRVLATGAAVAVSDVSQDPSFLRGQMTSDTGVKGAFAFPVRVGDEVVGVLEFFSGRAVELDAGFLEVMAHVGTQLGRVVERERARAALSRSEQRFRQLAENIREVFWITTPELDRILYVSPAYEEVWGRSREELYEDPLAWLEAIHPEDRERVDAAEAARVRGSYEEEYRVRRPDGSIRWILDRAFPVYGEDGEVVRVVGIAEDITDQKEAEQERARLFALEQEAREKAEDAVRTRDDVMRMVSHDLRSPLSTIGMAAALLEEIELEPEQQARQVDVIRRTADHMQRLVQGLLDLKRLEAGHGIPVDPRPVDVAPLLAEGCTLFQTQADAKGVEIAREAPAELPRVRADSERVLQVLWNLTGNAIKFTPRGGRVVLRAEELERNVRFSVTDTGPGIAPENLERLFDPFWQAKRTARLGTGLGLPISKAIVEAHDGRIWAETEQGKGSTFYFTLPKADER